MEFPVDLLAWKEGFIGENVPPPEENVQHHDDKPIEDAASKPIEHGASEPVEHTASDEIDRSEDDNNYEVVDESEYDSDVSLVEKDRVADFGNPNRCDPDNDESIIILSSDEENGLTRALHGHSSLYPERLCLQSILQN
ncbi:hypothetical protein Q3G72_034881 [Acer saccharum]|nr:hypothetical protein Q3G72_034881 [Acer saccharum]